MKKWFCLGIVVGVGVAFLVVGVWIMVGKENQNVIFSIPTPTPKTYPLSKYTIESLMTRQPNAKDFALGRFVATMSAYTVREFGFRTEGKYVSGLAHIPGTCSAENKCPVIVQSRGYIYPAQFVSGAGTAPSGRKFAEAGFVSLAPDFLGFGNSDSKSENIFEARFQTYTTVIDLLSLINQIDFVDSQKVGLWGHSNGGQITLTTLVITGQDYPSVLWAPVTSRFPYSILYYSDEDVDGGKGLRRELAKFEADYDTDMFWFGNYLEKINAPIQLSVGGNDDLVPLGWGRKLVSSMKKLEKEVVYQEYPQADHNLKTNWDEVVTTNIDFYRQYFSGEVDKGFTNR